MGLARALDRVQPDSQKLRRRHPRIQVDAIMASCCLSSLGEPAKCRDVPIVDISNSGIQIIWPGFLHEGTKLSIRLQRPGAERIDLDVTTKWCRFIRGGEYAVGAQAASPIPIRDLVSQKVWLDICAQNPEMQHPVAGRLTLYTTQTLTAHSVHFQIQDSQLTPNKVSTRGALMDVIERGDADVVVLDGDSESMGTIDLLKMCRQKSFNGPIVLLSLDKETEYLASMDPLSRARFVQLPLGVNAIVAAVRDVVRDHPDCMTDSMPIYSDSPMINGRENALTRYIGLATKLAKEGADAIELGDIESAKKVAESLIASGGSHGYMKLSRVASEFRDAAQDSSNMQKQLKCLFEDISSVIRRLHPGVPDQFN